MKCCAGGHETVCISVTGFVTFSISKSITGASASTATTTDTVVVTSAGIPATTTAPAPTTLTVTAASELVGVMTATAGTTAVTGASALIATTADTAAGPVVETAQEENSLSSLTPHPIQEQEVGSTDTEDLTQVGTRPQGEAGDAYENLYGK